MKAKNLLRAIHAVFFTAVLFNSSATPLNPADVAANPAWVVHVDFDALRKTYLGEYLIYQLTKPEFHSNILSFQSIFGFDLRTNLHAMTFYARSATPNDRVAITYADIDTAHLLNMFTGLDQEQLITNNHHIIHSWVDPKAGRRYAVMWTNRLLGGDSQKGVISALAVMDGRKPNFSNNKESHELEVTNDPPFFQFVATNLDTLTAQPRFALFKSARNINLHVEELNRQASAVLTIQTGDEDTAQQMALAAQGYVALLGLQKDVPAFAKLATGITFKQNGSTWSATLSLPSPDVVAAAKAYLAKNGQ